jgi:heme exporter protein C
MTLYDLAHPSTIFRFCDKFLKPLAFLTLLAFAIAGYMAVNAPEDYQQGRTVLIMFIHVPLAWGSMAIYMLMTSAALGTLVWKHPLADVAAKAAAPLGAAFAFCCLVTGSLWGKPMWGTYWVWDARLTSMLVLFLIYLGLIALYNAADDPLKAGRIGAILTLAGVINIPIIKFSVEWWNTLHQPASVIRSGGSAIHPALLYPLLAMAVAFALLFFTLHFMAMRNELLARRLARQRSMEAFEVKS